MEDDDFIIYDWLTPLKELAEEISRSESDD